MDGQRLILIAEDDPVLRLIIVKQLSKLGYVAHTAANGAEAVVMASKIPYALILMDVHMPKMDGLSATKQIRRSQRLNHSVPVVALTATADRELCIEAGMNDFISKPITLEQLRDLLRRWVGEPADVGRAAS